MSLPRGEIQVRIGGQTRTFQWRTTQMMLLQKRLECDVLQFIAKGGGVEHFLVEAMFCGSVKQDKKISPGRVAAWLDDDNEPIQVSGRDVGRDDLMQEILYTMARGKTEKDQEEMIRILDEIYGGEKSNGVGPLPDAPFAKAAKGMTSSFGSEPPSA